MFLHSNKKESPYWQVIYEINGKRTKISTKTKDEKEAEKIFLKFQLKQELNLSANNSQQPLIHSIILSKFKEEYLTYSEKTKSKNSIRSIDLSFNQLMNFIGDVKLNKISTKDVDQFITSVYSRAKSAAGLYYRTLKAAFSKAVSWDYIPDNPFKKIKAPKIPKALPSFISLNELNQIVEQEKSELLKNIYITGFYTGMRLGELLNMKWNWIDFKQNSIAIKNSNDFLTKGKKERVIPMNPVVQITMKKRIPIPHKNDFVFIRMKGIKLNEDFVSKSFKQAVRGAKLNDEIHFHRLRHSFASNLVQKGVSLYVAKELLGHEDLKTTQIYSHLQQENLSQAVNLL